MIKNRTKRGFSLVEVVIVSGLIAVVFTGLLMSFRYSLELVANSRAKLSALSLANDRMEYFRSLPYASVGTVAGIPPGVIPQNSSTTLNDIVFYERVLVEYVDDPADGILGSTTNPDINDIPSDYKRLKVEISWLERTGTSTIAMVSNIVPSSIETTEGGGSVRISVRDGAGGMVPGASVRLFNTTLSTPVDVTRFATAAGEALFSGAPSGTNYEVYVTAPGYSYDQTYAATPPNSNPITPLLPVIEANTESLTFTIGALSDFTAAVYTSITEAATAINFSGVGDVETLVNTVGYDSVLRLATSSGNYVPTGMAYLAPVIPAPLEMWGSAVVQASTTFDTTYSVQVFSSTTSGYVPVPDSDLPGNSSGFAGPVIPLGGLSPSAYPAIVLGFTLETSNAAETPVIHGVTVYYRTSSVGAAGVPVSVVGSRPIGATDTAVPIPKFTDATTTDSTGSIRYTDIEYDTYTLLVNGGSEIARACPAHPIYVSPGSDTTLELELTANVDHSLRTKVLTSGGVPLPGAMVTLTRTGFSGSDTTDLCGQAFLPALEESDFELQISAPGFVTETIPSYSITGDVTETITLNTL